MAENTTRIRLKNELLVGNHYCGRLLEEIRKLTECCICFSDEEIHMKQLVCQHTCCTNCLELLMRHKMRVEVHCPICREKTVIPHGDACRLPDSLAYRQLKDLHTKYMAEHLELAEKQSTSIADVVVSESDNVEANGDLHEQSRIKQLQSNLTESMSQLSHDFEECEKAKTAWMKAHWGSPEYKAALQRYHLADTKCSTGRRTAAALQRRLDKLLRESSESLSPAGQEDRSC